jgi:hypothetical protein
VRRYFEKALNKRESDPDRRWSTPQAKVPAGVKRFAPINHTGSRIPAADQATASAGCAGYFFDQ